MSADPPDTLRITGGAAIATVDADSVRAAAAQAGCAAQQLQEASWQANAASSVLADAARQWSTAPEARGAYQAQADAAAADARTLSSLADACARLQDGLLKAAGLYEYHESVAEKLVGTEAFVAGAAAPFSPGLVLIAAISAAEGIGLTWLVRKIAQGGNAPSIGETAAAAGRGLTKATAGYTDEFMAGLGWGIAAATAPASGWNLSVTGAAMSLSGLVESRFSGYSLAVVRLASSPNGRGFTSPDWANRPSGTVAEALERVYDITGVNAVPGHSDHEFPPASIGVEKVRHDDGTISWTVLIPGTQDFLSDGVTTDGRTDLALMAQQGDDITAAVSGALASAGAAPNEPVVLVGWSLGGIAAMALASSPGFREQHPIGAVVTAGSPTATFRPPPGVPILHLANDEELVSNLDGASGEQAPRSPDEVSVTRRLADSNNPLDQAAASSIAEAHQVTTHLRTLEAATQAGNAQVLDILGRIEPLLSGDGQTTFYQTIRVPNPPSAPAPEPTPTPGPAPTPPPGG